MVHLSRGQLDPASDQLRSEPAIVAGIATALWADGGGIDWCGLVADYDRIRDAIADVIPGFADFNRRVRAAGGFQLPNPARERDFSGIGGKARFTTHELPDLSLPPGRFRLTTVRSHDQFNTTIYGLDDRYRGVYRERRVVFMNRADMEALGLSERQRVDLVSEHQGSERTARGFYVVVHDLPSRCLATYFPEGNVLVPLEQTARGSNTPAYKSVIVRIEPMRA